MKRSFAMLLCSLCLALPTVAYAQTTAADGATYTVTFTSIWHDATHPYAAFPANAHFSSLIGATHNLSATFWLSGTLASPGIEQMAETGGTSLLRAELSAAAPPVREILAGPGLGSSPGQVTIPAFTVSRSQPLVTLVTMIAPSPDWFVGVHGLTLLDDQNEWHDEMTVMLYPYDAGTDDGTDYTSANVEPATQQPVKLLRGLSPFAAAPIGTFTFTRVNRLYLPLISRPSSATTDAALTLRKSRPSRTAN